MKRLLLIILIVVAGIVASFLLLYKNNSVSPRSNRQQSKVFCTPDALKATISFEGAAGSTYGTVTIQNISSNPCYIQGNHFISATFPQANIVLSLQGKPGSETIQLLSSQKVYSQVHYPNGAQCQGTIKQIPVNFTYRLAPDTLIELKATGATNAATMTICASNQTTSLDVWSLSEKPLH